MATPVLARDTKSESSAWRCDLCLKSGTLDHTNPINLGLLTLENHRKQSPNCEGQPITLIRRGTDAGRAVTGGFQAMPDDKSRRGIFSRILSAICD